MKGYYPLHKTRVIKCRYQWRVDTYDTVLQMWIETVRVETKAQAQSIAYHYKEHLHDHTYA